MHNVWERRSFYWTTDDKSLVSVATDLSERVEGKRVKDVEEERDVYLVVPGIDHNIKVREADLELKLKIEVKLDGCMRWQDKLQWTFPLDAERTAAMWAWLLSSTRPPPPITSAEDLVTRLREHTPVFGLVSVDKRRCSFKCDGTKIEVGDITVAGAPQLRTICVEGETIEVVRAVVKKGNLDFGGAVCSYIELLQTALLWTPAARAAAGIGG